MPCYEEDMFQFFILNVEHFIPFHVVRGRKECDFLCDILVLCYHVFSLNASESVAKKFCILWGKKGRKFMKYLLDHDDDDDDVGIFGAAF